MNEITIDFGDLKKMLNVNTYFWDVFSSRKKFSIFLNTYVNRKTSQRFQKLYFKNQAINLKVKKIHIPNLQITFRRFWCTFTWRYPKPFGKNSRTKTLEKTRIRILSENPGISPHFGENSRIFHGLENSRIKTLEFFRPKTLETLEKTLEKNVWTVTCHS